jgi:amino acid transporter
MFKEQLFARKSLEKLHEEMKGENRLRRILGPIALTSLGVGAIIGAGIFVMTGRSAATDAGPAVVLSFVVAGIGCALAALCYAEFAAMAPVAGSAYTYAYATLGEVFAWMIGWDLVLEYAMACACVSASWSKYFNEFLRVCHLPVVPHFLIHDPFSTAGAWFNLPAALITIAVTIILVIGIRESATTNAVLVGVKVGVVLFVIGVGAFFISTGNWFGVPVADRISPAELAAPDLAKEEVKDKGWLTAEKAGQRIDQVVQQVLGGTDEAPNLNDAKTREELARKMKQEMTAFWYETGKLPEEEANLRIDKLTIETLALYKFDEKRRELEGQRGGPLPAGDRAPLLEALATVVAKRSLAVRDKLLSNAQDEPGKAKAAATVLALLVDTVADTTAVLRRKDQLTADEARSALDKTLQQYTGPLIKQHQLTEEQARAARDQADASFLARLPPMPEEQKVVEGLLAAVQEEAPKKAAEKWGILAYLGLNSWLERIDDHFRGPYMPYGLSGIMLGAAIVFFAYIGFDAISTHSEEAIRPQRDVPIGILASLAICTVLYILVSAVITGMERYPDINQEAAIAAAFRHKSEELGGNVILRLVAGLIAVGALAGMTSVLLITFLSQARIFLAMARDRLLPPRIFGAVHQRFRTPHISTMLTGGVIAVVSAITPITELENMVNIGTLMAFVIVCAAVLLLRIRRPEAERPFRTPVLFLVAPLGIFVNLLMTLFLPPITWLRLVGWLVLGMCIYLGYGMRNSEIGKELRGQLKAQG